MRLAAAELLARPATWPALPFGFTAGGAGRSCAEQLLPSSAPWPAVPAGPVAGSASQSIRSETDNA
jgi:hypothetical protein